MRSADITPGELYAARVKTANWHKTPDTRRVTVLGKTSTGKWSVAITDDAGLYSKNPRDHFQVTPAAILTTWADHEYAEAHRDAIREDQRRDFTIRYEAERAAYRERVSAVAPAFAGITVDYRAVGRGSNRDEPDPIDLGEWITENFDAPGCGHGTITIDFLAAIAQRLREAQEAVLAAGGGWAGDVQDGKREVITLAPRASSTLAALEAAVERADD